MNTNAPQISRQKLQRGFSLIEVLVTMVVVAVGLMGLISLMMKGLQANASSGLRSVAINQAYDMADRMRANLTAVQAGNYDGVIPPGSTSTCPIAATGYVSPPTASSLGSCSACSTSCSVSDTATRDKCVWHDANAKLLPSGSGAVCKETANNWYSIYVSWDDGKTGAPNKTFILRFEP